MAQKTDTQLTTEANIIKNETADSANTATRIGDMYLDIIDSKKNNDEYKVYTAILNQSDTDPPTATVLKNTFGTLTLNYISPGLYSISSPALFTSNKTWLTRVLYYNLGGMLAKSYYIDVNNIGVSTQNSVGTYTDNLLTNAYIEIRVYP